MSTEPTRTDETTRDLVDAIAAALCDQEEHSEEGNAWAQDTDFVAELCAEAALAASERFWRDRIADEIAAAREAKSAELDGVWADEYERGDAHGYSRGMYDADHVARGLS